MSTAAAQVKVSGSRATFTNLAHMPNLSIAVSPPLRREAKQLVEVVVGCPAGISFWRAVSG